MGLCCIVKLSWGQQGVSIIEVMGCELTTWAELGIITSS